ncbi:hypothetical protein GBF38_014443, partial [Nibea albiflora]
SVAQSQRGSILAKAAVTDHASLPDDMPSPCLHIHKTLGIYGDSWGRQGIIGSLEERPSCKPFSHQALLAVDKGKQRASVFR